MSKIKYTKTNLVIKRQGEFYEVASCYTTPRSLTKRKEYNDPIFAALELDVDELLNKPRRFFDHLLSIMEYKRDHDDPQKSWYWQELIMGCEMWLSAVENGLYWEVRRLAIEVKKSKKKSKETNPK